RGAAGGRDRMGGYRARGEAWPRVWRQAPSRGGPRPHSRATPTRIRAVVRPGSPAARAWAAAGEVASSGRAALEPGLPLRALVEHGGDVVAPDLRQAGGALEHRSAEALPHDALVPPYLL